MRLPCKILKGTKAGHIPIEEPTVLELIVNARVAKIARHRAADVDPDQCARVDRIVGNVGCWPIVLQKSKVAEPRIFRENPKREAIADS